MEKHFISTKCPFCFHEFELDTKPLVSKFLTNTSMRKKSYRKPSASEKYVDGLWKKTYLSKNRKMQISSLVNCPRCSREFFVGIHLYENQG